jgi:hypothetical protein
MFPVALLLLTQKAFQNVLSILSGLFAPKSFRDPKGDFNGINYSGLPPTCFGFYQEWAV